MNSLLKKGFGLGGRFDRALVKDVPSTFPHGSDEWGMELALLESMNSVGISSPNPGVGCVLIRNGQILSKGHTQDYRKEHAERMAWNALPLDVDLSQVTAYVTLEPCTHVGFQPPCIDLLLSSNIPRVVIGTEDPDPRVSGRGVQKLRAAGKEVVVGVLQNEIRAWLYPFLRSVIKKSPIWVGKWAQTPDGYLADHQGHSKWITGERSRAYTHWLRQKYDVIVVGASTFIADQPQLTVRDCAEPIQRQPTRFVFDPHGRINPSDVECQGFRFLVCESSLPKKSLENVVLIEGSPEQPHLVERMKSALEAVSFERPLQSVMVEGGARLLNSLMEPDILDAIHIFTGIKAFPLNNPRYRVNWASKPSWICASHQKFEQDDLREWVKGVLMS